MASLWYCCGCNFGPHNSSLYDSCIQCGRTRCARCVGEFNVTPEGSPPPNICDSCDQEHKGQAPQHAIENNKGGETDGTSRAKKDPSVPTALLRSTKYVFGFFPRRTRPTIPGTPREISLSSQPSYPAIPLQRESAEYILYSASLGSLMTHWIYEQSFCGAISSNQVQTLEAVLVEWKSTQPEILYTESNNKTSFWNSFKGILETLTGGVLDWRPFGPYRTPLVQGQTRICWECPCGDPRWVVVPQSFALKIEEYSRTNAAPPDGSNDPVYSRSLPGIAASAHGSGEGAKSQINSGQASGSNHSGSRAQCRSLENGQKLSYQLHAFLVLVNFSIFGSTHCLAQTAVHDMSDDEFFTWIRTSYYSHRGFLATWFGLYKYAHCEFFRFRRFDGYEYAPLMPEYPDEDQTVYHFTPKPMRPRPPMAPHEFNHWFYKKGWSRSARRVFTAKGYKGRNNKRLNFCGEVVQEKIPKRETSLEEGDPASEDFWGLYVVERRSALRLAIFSLAFLIPSVYFFFAWLFQWGHEGDIQNASIPITLSLAPIMTFWGFVLSTSPRFDSVRAL